MRSIVTCRGSDTEGNVANYTETEQVLQFATTSSSMNIKQDSSTEEVDGERCVYSVCSFVQIRGSIPVVWRQNVNLQYEPPIEIDDKNSQVRFSIVSKQVPLTLLFVFFVVLFLAGLV